MLGSLKGSEENSKRKVRVITLLLSTKYWFLYNYNQTIRKVTVWKPEIELRIAEQKCFAFLEIMT